MLKGATNSLTQQTPGTEDFRAAEAEVHLMTEDLHLLQGTAKISSARMNREFRDGGGITYYKVCFKDKSGNFHFRSLTDVTTAVAKETHEQGWYVDYGKGGKPVRMRADAEFWIELASIIFI